MFGEYLARSGRRQIPMFGCIMALCPCVLAKEGGKGAAMEAGWNTTQKTNDKVSSWTGPLDAVPLRVFTTVLSLPFGCAAELSCLLPFAPTSSSLVAAEPSHQISPCFTSAVGHHPNMLHITDYLVLANNTPAFEATRPSAPPVAQVAVISAGLHFAYGSMQGGVQEDRNNTSQDAWFLPITATRARHSVTYIVAFPCANHREFVCFSFASVVKAGKKIVALPEVQVVSMLPYDVGTDPEKLAEQFQDDFVDIGLVKDGWNDGAQTHLRLLM